MPKARCPKHNIILICPACMGERSSRKMTKAKKRANAANLKLAHAARRRYTKCKRYGSHRFSEVTGICPCGATRETAAL